jgi:alkanesulfonate monooxygenase SsuD/methylene tetrahydromethanopterin reductase-like flavin-dependent oxidoreductase (luciferase family)
LCSRSDANGLDQPLRILVIHPDLEDLAAISESLAAEDVPHIAIVGSPDNPKELLQAVYRAGVHDLHEFLFVQSLVSFV